MNQGRFGEGYFGTQRLRQQDLVQGSGVRQQGAGRLQDHVPHVGVGVLGPRDSDAADGPVARDDGPRKCSPRSQVALDLGAGPPPFSSRVPSA